MRFFVKFRFRILILFLLLLSASRLYNLDATARFTRDESSDLARMHEYWNAKKITLVGPISNDNVKVFGSLTYYMLMPFAVMGNFSPVSTAYGAAFWGIITGILLLLISWRIYPKLTPIAAVLIIVWYPLLESSRWAWNPHLMPVWLAGGVVLLLLFKHRLVTQFAAGVCFGLALHNHYIAAIPVFAYLATTSFPLIRNRKWIFLLSLWLGFVFSLLPFVIFDLRHPPGLFISAYIGNRTPHVQSIDSLTSFLSLLGRNIHISSLAMARTQLWSVSLMFVSLLLISMDVYKKQFKILAWLIPVFALIGAGVFLEGFETRYFFAGIVFFFIWIFERRKGLSGFVQIAIVTVLIISSLATSMNLMTKPQLPPSTRVISSASEAIISILNENPEIKNANITTDMSEDMDMLSEKYRDYLSIRGISFRAASEYDVSEHLFVITQADEASVRKSESYPLLVFGDQQVRGVREIPDTNWRVFWFSY